MNLLARGQHDAEAFEMWKFPRSTRNRSSSAGRGALSRPQGPKIGRCCRAATRRRSDPVGACVGMKGRRVSRRVQELRGEKIDIDALGRRPGTFVLQRVGSARVARVIIDEATRDGDHRARDQLFARLGRTR